MDWNLIGLLMIAICNAATAFMTWRHGILLATTSRDINLIEKATNSMKDELVKSTAEAAHAIGELKGRADQKKDDAPH